MDAQRFPRISSTDDLCRTWQIILEEQGQGLGRTLWLAWLDPLGVRDPVVAGIEDVPAQPDASDVRHIRDLLDHFTDVEAPYILFSRPGSCTGRGEWSGRSSGEWERWSRSWRHNDIMYIIGSRLGRVETDETTRPCLPERC